MKPITRRRKNAKKQLLLSALVSPKLMRGRQATGRGGLSTNTGGLICLEYWKEKTFSKGFNYVTKLGLGTIRVTLLEKEHQYMICPYNWRTGTNYTGVAKFF